MKHWNRIWNSEHLHTLFVVYVPFLLFFISLPMAFFPQTKVFLVGFACLLLAIMVQYAGSYRIWIFLTFLLLLCYIISANYLGVKFYEICVNSILLTLLSLFSGSRLQSTEYEQLRSRQENALSKQLTERNKNLMSIRGMDAIQQQLMRDIEDTCGYPTAFFSVTGDDVRQTISNPPGLLFYDREMRNIKAAAASGKVTGVGTNYCVHSVFRCYPVFFSGQVSGVMAVLIGVSPPEQGILQFLDGLANRGFIAMERQNLVDTQTNIMTEKQVEAARSSFLFAISHDFRTPLTAIMGACAELEGMSDLSQTSMKLVMAIREESAWLAQMVENLLSITRMNTGELNLALNDEVLEEIVGEAASKCSARYPSLKLNVSVPDEVMILRADATLIIQVLLNLVENAVKYGDASQIVELSVFRQEDSAIFSVRDYGKGIPENELENLFKAKALRSGDTKLGLGIGLSICHTIVEAHGGRIWVENVPEGGADFRFSLPLEVINV